MLWDQDKEPLGAGEFKAMWLGPYVVSKVLKKGAYELIDFDGDKIPEPRNGSLPEEVLCLGLALFLVFLLYVTLCTIVYRFLFLCHMLVVTDVLLVVHRFCKWR